MHLFALIRSCYCSESVCVCVRVFLYVCVLCRCLYNFMQSYSTFSVQSNPHLPFLMCYFHFGFSGRFFLLLLLLCVVLLPIKFQQCMRCTSKHIKTSTSQCYICVFVFVSRMLCNMHMFMCLSFYWRQQSVLIQFTRSFFYAYTHLAFVQVYITKLYIIQNVCVAFREPVMQTSDDCLFFPLIKDACAKQKY